MNDNANLINFNDDETTAKPQPDESASTYQPSTTISAADASHLPACFIAAPLRGRESLDNNPFDSVQKLVNRPDDPFEIVEQEACFKARLQSALPPAEVKLGNLLSLSDDNLLDDHNDEITPESEGTPSECTVPKFGSDSTMSSAGSTIYHSATTANLDLDSESPPISMSAKWTPEHSGSASSTDGGGVSGIKTRSAVEHRKRLLKLSISNSTFNSPVSRRMPESSHNNNEMGGFCGASDDDACSPMTALFSKASLHCNDHMLASESPLKLIGDDDLMAEEPPSQFLDAEREFDADLEMLKIPMLKELPSPVVKHPPSRHHNAATSNEPSALAQSVDNAKTAATNAVIGLSDLAVIRAKLRAKREEASNNQDISLLIQNLKALICDIDDGGDSQKKERANSLLESLSCALAPPQCNKQQEVPASPSNLLVPQPIIRQGTFDLDLQEKEETDRQANATNAGSTVIGELSHMTLSTHSTHSVQSMPPFEDIPDAMVKSSATYDGESAADKGDLVLPEVINTFSPPVAVAVVQPPPQPDVNDIIEQLSKLLEQRHFTQQSESAANGGQANTNAPLNPTFIVVMNSSSAVTHPPNDLSAKQRSSYVAQYMESSFSNGSPDLHNSSATIRRRTQSLSLHDKVKIVQLPMQPPQCARPLQQAASMTALEQHDSPPLMHTPPLLPTPPMDSDGHEFKTPLRMMPPRRNSFTSGTPYTPMNAMAARRSTVGTTEISSRRLSTHHESQHAATPRPTSMPHASNVTSFKPDLKKKLKTCSSQESIMKSSGPLKATIPVKKIAPMLKISPSTSSRTTTGSTAPSSARKSVHNSSMHLLTKSGKMAYTSTPMPLSRSAGTLGVPATGYPNACSTPTVHKSPLRRVSASTTKPRYSYMSATPSGKPTTSAAAAAGLKRRTLSELRTKSPIKPRVSGVGGSAAASTSSSARAASRTSLKLPQSTANFMNKTAQTPAASGRSSLRPSSTRASIGNNTGPNKNKENKLP